VAVAVGHYLNGWVTFREPSELSQLEAVLTDAKTAPFIRYHAGPSGENVSAVACVRDRDRALVGRLRRDARDASGRSVCLTMAGDNLRLGAATNAIRIASRWFASTDPELQA
jgi:aspartate-semialdehyde dehydrogenase